MIADSRLNLLLTHNASAEGRGSEIFDPHHQPWYRSLSALLAPMGVKTFEATTGQQAMAVIEQNPIHLAVVDSRLTSTDELSLPKLIQKIRETSPATPKTVSTTFRVNVKIEGTTPMTPVGQMSQRIELRLETQPCDVPAVILLTPARNDQMLPEALKHNVFSVVNEPVDIDLMLEIMARALKRFHQNCWPK